MSGKAPTFKVGDRVRVLDVPLWYEKYRDEFEPSEETFEIKKVEGWRVGVNSNFGGMGGIWFYPLDRIEKVSNHYLPQVGDLIRINASRKALNLASINAEINTGSTYMVESVDDDSETILGLNGHLCTYFTHSKFDYSKDFELLERETILPQETISKLSYKVDKDGDVYMEGFQNFGDVLVGVEVDRLHKLLGEALKIKKENGVYIDAESEFNF